jgi:hypothetical protein
MFDGLMMVVWTIEAGNDFNNTAFVIDIVFVSINGFKQRG